MSLAESDILRFPDTGITSMPKTTSFSDTEIAFSRVRVPLLNVRYLFFAPLSSVTLLRAVPVTVKTEDASAPLSISSNTSLARILSDCACTVGSEPKNITLAQISAMNLFVFLIFTPPLIQNRTQTHTASDNYFVLTQHNLHFPHCLHMFPTQML